MKEIILQWLLGDEMHKMATGYGDGTVPSTDCIVSQVPWFMYGHGQLYGERVEGLVLLTKGFENL